MGTRWPQREHCGHHIRNVFPPCYHSYDETTSGKARVVATVPAVPTLFQVYAKNVLFGSFWPKKCVQTLGGENDGNRRERGNKQPRTAEKLTDER